MKIRITHIDSTFGEISAFAPEVSYLEHEYDILAYQLRDENFSKPKNYTATKIKLERAIRLLWRIIDAVGGEQRYLLGRSKVSLNEVRINLHTWHYHCYRLTEEWIGNDPYRRTITRR